jgi:hypothetical protein
MFTNNRSSISDSGMMQLQCCENSMKETKCRKNVFSQVYQYTQPIRFLAVETMDLALNTEQGYCILFSTLKWKNNLY